MKDKAIPEHLPVPKADRRHRRADTAPPTHDEWLLDEALKETFPASDPIAPALPVDAASASSGRRAQPS
jgi:hypothetical protein